ncbi:hypothetical protein XI07_15460 [Bradyrhizobium sp. CCBAU 11445]|nr:hypothetical protein [Bradyrhizobium sp. CCBAU 11445]
MNETAEAATTTPKAALTVEGQYREKILRVAQNALTILEQSCENMLLFAMASMMRMRPQR